MSKFEKTWSSSPNPGMSQRMGDMIKPRGPLKPRVQTAIGKLQKQSSKLDGMLAKLGERDSNLFARIVDATQKHDTHTSKVLSSELAEVRKVSRVIGNARVALQQMELRLSTCSDLGDTVMAIMPTIGLMKGMKSSLVKFMPGADQEINKMGTMLQGIMMESFSGPETTFGADTVSDEATEKILQEAAAIASTSLDGSLPPTPMDLGGQSESETTKFM